MDDKIVSLVEALQKKDNEGRQLHAHLGVMFQACGILADAIEVMRDEGVGDDEIVWTLKYAAEVLSGADRLKSAPRSRVA